MIRLTRLDGEPFVLNAELIRYIEARPDTFITLLSGERLVVKETMDEVLDRTVRYQQSKYLIPAPLQPAPQAPRWSEADRVAGYQPEDCQPGDCQKWTSDR